MAKFASTIILVTAIISVQGGPITYDEILAAARQGQWAELQDFSQSESDTEDEILQLKTNLGKNPDWKNPKDPASFNSVRELKPTDGGHVYGEAEYSFHSASNIDGKTSEEHAGHKIINNDGKVKEFDFTPSSTEFPLLSPIITGQGHSQVGNDYGASDYSFHYAPTGVGEISEYIGGKKINSKQQQDAVPSALKIPITLQPGTSKPHQIPSEEYSDQYTSTEIEAENKDENQAVRTSKNHNNGSEVAGIPKHQIFDSILYTKEPEERNVSSDVDYAGSAPAISAEALAETVVEEQPNKNSQTVDKNKNQNVPQTTDSVFNSKTFENLLSGLQYSMHVNIPATKDQVSRKRNTQKPFRTQSTIRRTPKRPSRMDQDYIAHVASAIQEELEELSGNMNTQHKKKINGGKRNTNGNLPYPLSFTGVRNLKPEKGGHVYGEAQYAYRSATNVDGKTSEERGGHKVINDDGKIKEFNFQPKTIKPFFPAISFTEVRDLKPPQGGQVYGEAQYAYKSATNVNGQTTEEKGGHKIINNNGKVKEFDFTPSADQTNIEKAMPLSVIDKDIGILKSLFLQ